MKDCEVFFSKMPECLNLIVTLVCVCVCVCVCMKCVCVCWMCTEKIRENRKKFGHFPLKGFLFPLFGHPLHWSCSLLFSSETRYDRIS